MKISVISDLHIGEGARGKDFCPSDHPNWLDKNYKKDFLDFTKNKKISSDYLIIPGDISDRAKFSQFQLAESIILEIANALKVDKEKIIYVPGNHDTDWSETSLDTDNESDKEFRKNQRYESFIKGFKINIKNAELTQYPYHSSWEFDELFVVGYNSAWNDSSIICKHHGFIDTKIIADMEKKYSSAFKSNKTKIFVLHHHPYLYSNQIEEDIDFSAIANADSLLAMLSKYQFDMIIHGHRHIPCIKTINIDSFHPLSMLCAGSFSAKLDQRWNGQVLNMFHQINIEERDKESNFIIGHVENYTYLSNHKWIRSQKDSSGVFYKHAFGYYSNYQSIKKKLTDKISANIEEGKYINWKHLCEEDRNLNYLPPDFVHHLTKDIADDLNLEIISNESDILIYK